MDAISYICYVSSLCPVLVVGFQLIYLPCNPYLGERGESTIRRTFYLCAQIFFFFFFFLCCSPYWTRGVMTGPEYFSLEASGRPMLVIGVRTLTPFLLFYVYPRMVRAGEGIILRPATTLGLGTGQCNQMRSMYGPWCLYNYTPISSSTVCILRPKPDDNYMCSFNYHFEA